MSDIEITIEGLTDRQRAIADIIWACNTKAQIDKFIKMLPTKELQIEAEGVFQLILMASIEQAYDGLGDHSQALELINKVKKA